MIQALAFLIHCKVLAKAMQQGCKGGFVGLLKNY